MRDPFSLGHPVEVTIADVIIISSSNKLLYRVYEKTKLCQVKENVL